MIPFIFDREFKLARYKKWLQSSQRKKLVFIWHYFLSSIDGTSQLQLD